MKITTICECKRTINFLIKCSVVFVASTHLHRLSFAFSSPTSLHKMIKLLMMVALLQVIHAQMDYWSPYSPEAMHYNPLSAAGYPVSGASHGPASASSPLSGFYNHFAGPESRFASPLVQRYPPTLVASPAPAGHTCTVSSPPKIDWGDCPSLESKDEDKKAKEEKQKECMKNLELNENTTFSDLTPVLQNRVRECTLRKDELINEAGKYNYEKAMEKLKAKSLPENLNKKVEEAHIECKIEAEQKFRNSATSLAEVDSYNECMDFHLAMLCKIKVIKANEKVSNANSFHGIPPLPYASPVNVHGAPNAYGDAVDKIQILSQALRR